VVWTAAHLAAIHDPALPKDQKTARLRTTARQASPRSGIPPRDFRVANDALINPTQRRRNRRHRPDAGAGEGGHRKRVCVVLNTLIRGDPGLAQTKRALIGYSQV
jgi:hypothetical protein